MSAVPRPPFLPDNLDVFVDPVAKHGTEWFDYCKLVDGHVVTTESIVIEFKEQNCQLQLQNEALQKEVAHLRQELIVRSGVVKYQKEQLKEKEQEYFKAAIERERAILAVTPTVNTPARTPEPAAEIPAVTPMGAPASIDPPSAASV
jgi:hypothetical protein